MRPAYHRTNDSNVSLMSSERMLVSATPLSVFTAAVTAYASASWRSSRSDVRLSVDESVGGEDDSDAESATSMT